MSCGKYLKKRSVPVLPWVMLCIVMLSLTFGGVAAYLSASTDTITGDISVDSSVNPTIQEAFDGAAKSNVSINVGNPGYSVYVRAAVVVTWQDASGNVYWKTPEKTKDYSIVMNNDAWFFHDDGFWYYKQPITGGSTPTLITSCTPVTAAPSNGYTLNVEIIAQTVQAVGTTDGDSPVDAVKDAWGLTAAEITGS